MILQFILTCQCLVPLFKVHEGVMFDFLDSLHLAVTEMMEVQSAKKDPPSHFSPLKELQKVGLRHGLGQIPAEENLHPGHDVLVRLLLRVGPVHEHVTAPDLDLTRVQTPGEEAIMVVSQLQTTTTFWPEQRLCWTRSRGNKTRGCYPDCQERSK